VVGTVAAVSVNQRLRRQGPVARDIKFTPARDGTGRTKVSFRLTESDTVEVAVVGADDELTRVLASSVHLDGDDAKHRFFWDRRTESGRKAEPGRYRLRLTLDDADRVAISGERFVVKPQVGSP
jgi:flagellar hook assembly protein FlgD